MAVTKRFYKLGRVIFTVSHEDSAFEEILDQLLIRCDDDSVDSDRVYDVRLGWSMNFNELFSRLVELHERCLRICAASLVSQTGQKVLISGSSDAGKTAMALALVFDRRWKLLSEHSTLLDCQENEMIGFASPFCLKTDTRDLLHRAGVSLPPFILLNILPVGQENRVQDCQGSFDVAVHLEGEHNAALDCSPLTVSQYVRKLLPISNLIGVPGGIQRFNAYVSDEVCYQFTGGSLEQRLERLLDICEGRESKTLNHSEARQCGSVSGDAKPG